MALYYLETSALVKLYVREPGTERLLRLASSVSGNRFAVLALSQVEFRSAIRRRQRAGDIDATIADLILDRFQTHMESRFLRQTLTDSMLDSAFLMLDQYALRAYDAIQLAACLALQITFSGESPTFVCSDHDLLQAARSEQLPVIDPSVP
ncbi:MAG TPA: type II toxin-antitoxin system VapC family toxin [Candidatus Angelobacter sp.]|nr:type II toxin-antitoxin system VapC family toxin [Candidatus Angelobacter sp.]